MQYKKLTEKFAQGSVTLGKKHLFFGCRKAEICTKMRCEGF